MPHFAMWVAMPHFAMWIVAMPHFAMDILVAQVVVQNKKSSCFGNYVKITMYVFNLKLHSKNCVYSQGIENLL